MNSIMKSFQAPRIEVMQRPLETSNQQKQAVDYHSTVLNQPQFQTTNASIPLALALAEKPSSPQFHSILSKLPEDNEENSPQARISSGQLLKTSSSLSASISNKLIPKAPSDSLNTTKIINDNRIRRWFSSLINNRKILVRAGIVTIILGICSAAVLPAVLILELQKMSSSSVTSKNVSSCSSNTCIGLETPFRSSIVTVLYTFDGTTEDLYLLYGGSAMGSPPPSTYTTGVIVNEGINLNSVSSQCVFIPYMNLAKQSFTLQMWLYIVYNIQVDYGIFSQCSLNSICFSLSLRNGHVTLSFDSMNNNSNLLVGATTLPQLIWVHVSVVYDSILLQQLIYVNGIVDAVSSGIVYPYQGTLSSQLAYIGFSSSLGYVSSYYNGWMDHFTISIGTARTSCEVYNDATLTAYFPFNTNGPLLDYSVNMYYGYQSGVEIISSGRVQQAISFITNKSYFQSQCFPSTRVTNTPFSVSLWVNPNSVNNGGTIVHVSTYSNGTGSSCYDLLGLTTSGTLIMQISSSATLVVAAQGPILSTDTWTHLVVVYSGVNGARLYINGQINTFIPTVTGSLATPANNNIKYVTLANTNPWGSNSIGLCLVGPLPISPGSYNGSIDEFRLYSRELTAQEICVLANP